MPELATCNSNWRLTKFALISIGVICALTSSELVVSAEQDGGSQRLSYDVVSVRPNNSTTLDVMMGFQGRGYSAKNVKLVYLIQNAYGIKTDSLISEVPKWARSARYDVEARMDEHTAAALEELPHDQQVVQRRLMLQALLADRFKLKIEPRKMEVPIYALVIAKGGPKLKPADPNDTYFDALRLPPNVPRTDLMMMEEGKLTAHATTITRFADQLSGQVDRIVEDKTGLTGRYDFTLKWAPDEHGSPRPDDPNPPLFTALPEQLGLKLESKKEMAQGIRIVHAEKPSEN